MLHKLRHWKPSGQSKRIAPFETSNYSEIFPHFSHSALNCIWGATYGSDGNMKQFWWSLKLRLLWEIETSVSQNTPSWTHVSKIKVPNCQQNCCACAVKNNYVKWWSKVQKINSAAVHTKLKDIISRYIMYHNSYTIFLWLLRI